MNKILMLSCILVIKFAKTSASYQEIFLMNQLLPYFDDPNGKELAFNEKYDAERVVVEPEYSEGIPESESMRDRRRADHYWTRKRGRESTTTVDQNYNQNYNQNYPYSYPYAPNPPTQFGFPSSFYYLRGKRDVESKQEQEVRQKREVKEEKLIGEKKALDVAAVVAGDSSNNLRNRADPNQNRRQGGPGVEGNFKRSMLKCCSHDSNPSEMFNHTIDTIKFQCQKSVRKSMNSSFDDIHDEDSVLSVTACDKAVKMKVMMFCVTDCVAQNNGVIDDHGLINIDAAKKIVMENIASETWEKQVSDEIVDKCVTKVNESKRENVDSMGLKCSIRPAEFAYCVWRQMFLSCPQDKQLKNQQCDRLRQSMKPS